AELLTAQSRPESATSRRPDATTSPRPRASGTSVADTIRFSDHVVTRGEELFAAARSLGLEGIIAKRADSRYRSERSRDWVKIKLPRTVDVAIVGYVAGRRSRGVLGSLMVAWYEGDELVYAGNVGSGLDGEVADRLRQRLEAARRPDAA